MDRVGVFAHVRRDHARIDRGESAADIDDIDEYAGAADRASDLGHGGLVGAGTHALRADVEAYPHQAIGDGAARGQKQGRGLVGRDAELARQRIGRTIGGDGHAHHQVQIRGTAGGIKNLQQLVVAVERKGAHAQIEIGARDRIAALDRMHEGQTRIGADRTHQFDLGERGDVE